ncbi:MAG: type II toxin-antitoxin system VapB family antitoxin [Pseudomonadota bacterium]|jgi:Arc/MetJ family transcription regulator
MRTNIVLNDKLIREAMRLTGVKTKRQAVDLALRNLIARGKQKHILALAGQDLIAPDYDVRQVRRKMTHGAG